MWVGSTGPVKYLTCYRRNSRVRTCSHSCDIYLGWLIGPRSLLLFPECRGLLVFFLLCSLFFVIVLQRFVVCAPKMRNNTTHTSALLTRARRARPPGRPDMSDRMAPGSTPTSELSMQSPVPTVSIAEPPSAASSTGAVDVSAGAAIREDPGPAAGVAADVASAAAALLLHLVAASTTALAFLHSVIFRTGMIFHRYFMFTYVVHGLLYCHVLCLLLHPARACALAFLVSAPFFLTRPF